MTGITQDTGRQNSALRALAIAVLLVAAFLGAYKLATAPRGRAVAPAAVAAQVTPQAVTPTPPAPADRPAAAGTPAPTAPAAGTPDLTEQPRRCGSGSGWPGGITGPPVEGTARVFGNGVQSISVEVVGTTYSPNVIKLKAGVPAEITFGQSSGCTAVVMSSNLGFSEDLSAGPKVVKLSGLKRGEYAFSCDQGLVFGSIVVE